MKKISDEKGGLLMAAILLLVLITGMGIAVSRIAEIELIISRNERSYTEEFYASESALVAGCDYLDSKYKRFNGIPEPKAVTDLLLNDSDSSKSIAFGHKNINCSYEIEYVSYDDYKGVTGEGGIAGSTGREQQLYFRVTGKANGRSQHEYIIYDIYSSGNIANEGGDTY